MKKWWFCVLRGNEIEKKGKSVDGCGERKWEGEKENFLKEERQRVGRKTKLKILKFHNMRESFIRSTRV